VGRLQPAEPSTRLDGRWAYPNAHVALGLGTSQRTRGAWAALGWGQVALGS